MLELIIGEKKEHQMNKNFKNATEVCQSSKPTLKLLASICARLCSSDSVTFHIIFWCKDNFWYFLISGPRGTLQRVLQDLVGWTGLWEALHGGCSCNCQLWTYIDKAGFKEVSYKQFIPSKPKKTMWISPCFPYSSHLVGHAQK